MPEQILLVDDEEHVTKALKRALLDEPYEIMTAGSGEEALGILEKNLIDVVVSDEMMPGMTGTDLLSLVSREFPGTIRILLTGHASLETAERAIKHGEIFRFLAKPWNDVDLIITIRQAIQMSRLSKTNRVLLQKLKEATSILQDLEHDHPGITRINTDSDGSIIIDDLGDEAEDILSSFAIDDPDE